MSTLNLQVLFDAKDRITGPMKAIIGGSNELTKAFKQTHSQLKNLESQQRVVNQFKELDESLSRNRQKLIESKKAIEEFKSRISAGVPTFKMVKDLAQAEEAHQKLTKKIANQYDEFVDLKLELQDAGANVKKLADYEDRLQSQIESTNQQLNKHRNELDKNSEAQKRFAKTQAILQKGSDFAKKGLMVAGVATATMTVPVKLAIDYESSLADVKKVFNGTAAEFKTINNEIVEMSTRLPMAAKDIAAIVAAGAQSGIASKELTTFAETAVKMGVAFDISAEESGQSMAELRTAFRMSQAQVTTLADQINYLGNNTPAAAKGILEIVQRIGPLGEVGGYAASSIAALGATLRGMGIQEEIAATGIKNTMLALVAGESATKGQIAAYKELGLDYGKVAKDMQQDANGTTLMVLKKIATLEKYKQAAVLSDLFGKESLSAIAPLLTNMSALEKNLGLVADKSKYAGSMEQEYAARAATSANNIQLLKNSVAALGIDIGNVLLPPLNSVITKARLFTNTITNWAKENPILAASLTKVAVGGVILLGAVSALALGVLTLVGPLAMLKLSIATVGSGASIAATALKLMLLPIKMIGLAFLTTGRMLLANPMILAITALVAVVAGAAYLIYKNWTPITQMFNQVWTGVKNAFSSGINYIKGVIQSVDTTFANNPLLNLLVPIIGIPRTIIANWSVISGFFSDIWQQITSTVSTGVNTLSNYVSSGFSTVSQIISTAWNNVKNTASAVWSGIKNIVSTAWNALCTIFLTVTPLGYIIRNFNAIVAFLTSLGSRMVGIGKNIVDGLINGIVSGFNRLKGVWEKINNYMPDFMRKKMDIHSPSRVMAGMGGHIVDGIGVGLNNRTPALQTQFKQTLGIFDTSMPTVGSGMKRPFLDTVGLTEKPVPTKHLNGQSDRSQQAPKFQRVAAIQSPRSISITNSDSIQIHINTSGQGPLHNAANEVRQALEQRDRQRNAQLRRMLTDRE